MKTLLKKIFDELFIAQKVKNQTEFGTLLGYDGGYMSKMFRQESGLPHKFQIRLTEVFGISSDYLSSNGKSGTMFAIPNHTKSKPYESTATADNYVQEDSPHIPNANNTPASMVKDLMNELRESNASMRMLAQAVLNATETNKSLARSVEQLTDRRLTDTPAKRQAS